jgi:prephenate dehydrogenase
MPVKPFIDTLAIVGVGLIGGSFSLALKRQAAVRHVVGIGRSRANLERAHGLGIIDRIAQQAPEGVAQADVVLLAVPTGQYPAVLRSIAGHLKAGAVVTDAGSTKQDVVAHARQYLPGHCARFVPGHPIAGTERSGAEAAFADLYNGKRAVLTPLPENDATAIALVRSLWEACGADVSEMSPLLHDQVFAAVSHLPHALAYALVHMVSASERRDALFSFAASGFRDFTRIASSSPEMWRDICLSNRDALLDEIDTYQGELARMRGLIEKPDAEALLALFSRARHAREAWRAGADIPSE